MEISEMTNAQLVNKLVALKAKEAALKEECNKYSAEIQTRAQQILEGHNVKTVNFSTSKGAVSIGVKGTLSFVSALALQRVIGSCLFKEQVTDTSKVTYKPSANFETALKAIFLHDYDFNTSMEEVYDALNASSDQRKVLDKKLRGDFKKDSATLISMFGDDDDYETELYLIYKIKNAERIAVFFPEYNEALFDQIRKCIVVEEKIGITVQ